MCRSIKVLRKPGQAATAEELNGAALQFVRKVTGFHKPSKANQDAFERAIVEITDATDRLLKAMGASSPRGTCRSDPSSARGAQAPIEQPTANQ